MNNKRLGIFVFYDKEGIVREYLRYLLNDITQCFTNFIIVVNGKVNNDGMEYFKKLTQTVYVRENIGLDAGGFQFGINMVGEKELRTVEELVLFNDTFYGPFYHFEDMFNNERIKDKDFWGITANYESTDGKKIFKTHIQTYFMCFKNSILIDNAFYDYWRNLNTKTNNYFDIVYKHEIVLTDYFENLGFSWGTIVDTKKYSDSDIRLNYNPYAYSAQDLLKDNCPILKRKIFSLKKSESMEVCDSTQLIQSINYIKKNYDYNIDMIMDDIIRNNNAIDVHNNLCLDFIIKTESCNSRKVKKLIVFYCNDIRSLELFNEYTTGLKCDVFLITKNEDVCKCAEELNLKDIFIIESTHNNIILELIKLEDKLKKYDYLCYVDDTIITTKGSRYSYRNSVLNTRFSNLFQCEGYVDNIIELLQKEYKLKLVTTIDQFDYISTESERFAKLILQNEIKACMHKIGFSVEDDADYATIPIQFGFWIDMKCFLELKNAYNQLSKLSDFEAKISLPIILCKECNVSWGTITNEDNVSSYINNTSYIIKSNSFAYGDIRMTIYMTLKRVKNQILKITGRL
ncbi:rhamnan synthesis F family protein [Anaerorhabdus furcosa]|uniref:Rhamnosyltransferase n=1 Tax=Anaerorhabdus furcosa TaxID=118967 RepID=A0A1T4NZH8_9FIRM|nr:rhamnan synthesis F family protein [Anaerorhabdus furcosa]SJZ84456.1 rhamnosyltransferase [Anaerorhabdus furcosa]